MEWTQTIVGLTCGNTPIAVQYHTSPGSVLLLDSTLGPGLGPVAIATDGRSSIYLQNVVVLGPKTRFVVDNILPTPSSGRVDAWGAGAAYLSGVPALKGFYGALPLPSAANAAAQGVRT
jgi:hypothetical protein